MTLKVQQQLHKNIDIVLLTFRHNTKAPPLHLFNSKALLFLLAGALWVQVRTQSWSNLWRQEIRILIIWVYMVRRRSSDEYNSCILLKSSVTVTWHVTIVLFEFEQNKSQDDEHFRHRKQNVKMQKWFPAPLYIFAIVDNATSLSAQQFLRELGWHIFHKTRSNYIFQKNKPLYLEL